MDGDHQSIGEVLATLRDEYPDVTISKIRFLESQGLIDPERTPSGYRKFRDGDVARLRWILHQQKQNFLPLKVIKARLDEAGPDALPPDEGPIDPDDAPLVDGGTREAPAPKPRTRRKKSDPSPSTRATRAPSRRATSAPARAPEPSVEMPTLPLDDGDEDDLAEAVSGASLTRAELVRAAGLTEEQMAELEQYGIIGPAAGSGKRVVYDEDALAVATLAAGFARHGLGPRHLRMFRVAAEREAGLYDQVIAPRLKRRNPEARAQAREDLVELARLGRALRAAFLRGATATLLHD
jgi:DNA-binding transcriptional MerR regulator